MRLWLSSSTSPAPASMSRTNALEFDWASGNAMSFCAKFSHSLLANTKRQLSKPRVIIAPAASFSLNFAGIATQPFVSKLCLYSPSSIVFRGRVYRVLHRKGGLSPESSTVPHFHLIIYHLAFASKYRFFTNYLQKTLDLYRIFKKLVFFMH